MAIIVGIILGSFIATIINCDVEDYNWASPAMLFVSMGINIATPLIGCVVGFSLISMTKKFARIQKIEEAERQADKLNTDTYAPNHLTVYLASFAFSSFVLYMAGNLASVTTLLLTLAMFVLICNGYLLNSKNSKKDISRIILAIVFIFAATSLTVTRINNLNIFMLFYGFITVPNYIFPNLTYQLNRDDNALKGLSFSLTTQGAVANGIILAQALVVGSQKDTIGTLINTYVTDEARLFLIVTIIVVLSVYSTTKEYKDYYKSAPSVIANNKSKTNNKFALFSIVLGAFIAVTQYNPYLFIITTSLGILCTYIVRNNDTLRSMVVPNLLLSGLMLG